MKLILLSFSVWLYICFFYVYATEYWTNIGYLTWEGAVVWWSAHHPGNREIRSANLASAASIFLTKLTWKKQAVVAEQSRASNNQWHFSSLPMLKVPSLNPTMATVKKDDRLLCVGLPHTNYFPASEASRGVY